MDKAIDELRKDNDKWDLVFTEYIFDWKTNIAPLFDKNSSEYPCILKASAEMVLCGFKYL